MYKKSLIILSAILFVLCIFTGHVLANDDNTTENIKNGVTNVTDTVIDGVSRMGSDVRNGIGAVENGIEDTFDMNNDNANNDNTNDNVTTGTPGDYTATRTADTAEITGQDTTSLWVWMIVAVAAIVIVGLVWYYGTQNTTHHDE